MDVIFSGSFDCCVDCPAPTDRVDEASNGADAAIRIVGSNEPLSIAASPVQLQRQQPGGPGVTPCSACGAEVNPGSLFCRSCGHSLHPPSIPPSPALPEPLLVDGEISPQRAISFGLYNDSQPSSSGV